MLPSIFPSSGHSPAGGPVKVKERIEEAQRWLLFMRHCSTCNAGETQTCEHGERCKSGRALYRHMSTCQAGSSCAYPKCALVKAILKHHQKCTRIQCQICMPVKAYVHSKPASNNSTPSPTSGASATTHAGSHPAASSNYAAVGSGSGQHLQLQQILQAANHNAPPAGAAYSLPLGSTPSTMRPSQFPNTSLVPDPVLDPLAHPTYSTLPGQHYPLQPGMAPAHPTGALPPGTDPVSAHAYFLQLYMRAYTEDPNANPLMPSARPGRHSMDAALMSRSLQHSAQSITGHPAQLQQAQQGQMLQPFQAHNTQQGYGSQQPHQAPSAQPPTQPSHSLQGAHVTQQQPPQAQGSPSSTGHTTSSQQQLVGTKRPPPSPADGSTAATGRRADLSGVRVRGVGVASFLEPPLGDSLRDPRLYASAAAHTTLRHCVSALALCSPESPEDDLPSPAKPATTVVKPAATATATLLPTPPDSLPMFTASRLPHPPHGSSGEDPVSDTVIEDRQNSTGPSSLVPGTQTLAATIMPCSEVSTVPIMAAAPAGPEADGGPHKQGNPLWSMRTPSSPSPAALSTQSQEPSSSSGTSQQPSSSTGPVLSVASAMAAAAASKGGAALPVVVAVPAAGGKRSLTPPAQAEQAAALLLSLKQGPASPSL